MKQSIKEFKKGNAALLASTGLASFGILVAGAHSAMADGLYGGLSLATNSGEGAQNSASESTPDYGPSGRSTGAFFGYSKTINKITYGAELAMSGFTEGSAADPSYDQAYDIMWTADAKLRIGTDVGKLAGLAEGKLSAYGFAGQSFGKMNGYDADGYDFSGANFGVGVEMAVNDNMFVGIEGIQRNLHSYQASGESRAVSLRVGFKF